MIKHHISKYSTESGQYATSWIQLNAFNKAFCFSKKTVKIK